MSARAIPLDRRQFLGGLLAWGAGVACGDAPPATDQLPDEVLTLHRESPVFDLHLDTLLWRRVLGYDLARRHGNPLPRSGYLSHMDLPRAAEGGLDGAMMGLVVNPRSVRPELIRSLRFLAWWEEGKGFEQTLASLDLLDETARQNADRMGFARSGTQARALIAGGRFAALAALEGAHGIEDRIENARIAWERGLRMLGLVHFQSSAAAHPMTAPEFDALGLTPFGLDLVAEMESLGMVVDLAHVNARGVEDALGAMRGPFVVSHTACRALCDIPRNLEDRQIRRIADRGGVIGIAAGRWFLGRPGVAGFVDHVEHALHLGGTDAVALGSDWDGGIVPVAGLEDVRGLPLVTRELLERGWPPADVRKVLGENALRVLTEVCG